MTLQTPLLSLHAQLIASQAVAKAETRSEAEQANMFERQVMLAFLATVFMLLMISAAHAASVNTPMGDVLCTIVDMVYGNLGRGLATLAVVIIGVGATLGKTSWGLALTVAVGIAVIFNAATVVGYLGSGAEGCGA